MSPSDAPEASAPTFPAHPGAEVHFGFANTYARLPERFFARVDPTPVDAPRLIKVNTDLARALQLDPDALASPLGVQILAGNHTPEGAEPLAQAYAGHQFGHFVPQLGDGRAKLLGEVTGLDGALYDIQLKGAGPTPYSRRGDGRAALGPVLREYILSEAMAALGVPTTRALAAVTTGERVFREMPLPGAVFTRVAASHLRVGTFQYFAAQGDLEATRQLADYAIARHYPQLRQAKQPYLALLDAVIARHARLVAQWMMLGFIHGVMNTDNTSISGETIDYGPCAFLEAYDPDKVYSSIDQQGRYAYSNQSFAAQWNLMRLAESLLPLLTQESGDENAALASANESLANFAQQFEAARLSGLRQKLGLFTEQEDDAALAQKLLDAMAANGADFTLTFRLLCNAAAEPDGDAAVQALFREPHVYDEWAALWRERLQTESIPAADRAQAMRRANPAFIPRNHLVQAVIEAATLRQDFQPFEQLLDVVTRPWEDRPHLERFATPARPEEAVQQTFCGT
jgi:uncharacterized protein YdiU (UPF0061 family)